MNSPPLDDPEESARGNDGLPLPLFRWRRVSTWAAVVIGLAGLVRACWPRPPRIVVVSIRTDPSSTSDRLVTLRLENSTIHPFRLSMISAPGWKPFLDHRRTVLIDGVWHWTSSSWSVVPDDGGVPEPEAGGLLSSVDRVEEIPALGSCETVLRLIGPRPQCVQIPISQAWTASPWSLATWGFPPADRSTVVWSPVIFPDGVARPVPAPPIGDADLPESREPN